MALRNMRLPGPPSSLQKLYAFYERKGVAACAREALSYALFKNRLAGRIYHPTDTLLHRYRHYRQPLRFSDANPYKIISVPPEEIRYKLRLDDPARDVGYFNWWRERNRVYGGKWDRHRASFREFHRTLYDCFEAHFLDGVPWSETEFIQKVLEAVEAGDTTWHTCSSRQDVFDRCDELDRIWTSITTEGYRRQAAVTTALDWRKDYSEVMVNISRDGEYLQNAEGKHRLIMARLAGIDEIPVRVIVRHRQWQQLRNEIRNGETGDYPSHPDLEDL